MDVGEAFGLLVLAHLGYYFCNRELGFRGFFYDSGALFAPVVGFPVQVRHKENEVSVSALG